MKYFNFANEYAKSMKINFILFMNFKQAGDCYCDY